MEMTLTQVQEALKLCNYVTGTVDGFDGPETQDAVRRV
ncbi:peptidoglycan-binding protein [Eubacterium callanderi]